MTAREKNNACRCISHPLKLFGELRPESLWPRAEKTDFLISRYFPLIDVRAFRSVADRFALKTLAQR